MPSVLSRASTTPTVSSPRSTRYARRPGTAPSHSRSGWCLSMSAVDPKNVVKVPVGRADLKHGEHSLVVAAADELHDEPQVDHRKNQVHTNHRPDSQECVKHDQDQACDQVQHLKRRTRACINEKINRAEPAHPVRPARSWLETMSGDSPVARVRLNAITASTSHAALALNLPDGRRPRSCGNQPENISLTTCVESPARREPVPRPEPRNCHDTSRGGAPPRPLTGRPTYQQPRALRDPPWRNEDQRAAHGCRGSGFGGRAGMRIGGVRCG